MTTDKHFLRADSEIWSTRQTKSLGRFFACRKRRLELLYDVAAQFHLSHEIEPRHGKTNVLVSDLVRHKPGCTATEVARGLKFRTQKLEGLYYLCSENKGADQLRGYREADLRLCFRICKMFVFS